MLDMLPWFRLSKQDQDIITKYSQTPIAGDTVNTKHGIPVKISNWVIFYVNETPNFVICLFVFQVIIFSILCLGALSTAQNNGQHEFYSCCLVGCGRYNVKICTCVCLLSPFLGLWLVERGHPRMFSEIDSMLSSSQSLVLPLHTAAVCVAVR